jgi:predicted nucleotidyltransferase
MKKNCNLKRETAKKLIEELVERAKFINEQTDIEKFPYKITFLSLFGSYINTDKEKIGDIDVFFDMESKWENKEDETRFFLNSPENNGRNFIESLFYSRKLALSFLRNKKHSYSFHEMWEYDELVNKNKIEHKTIFECK